MRRSVFGFHLSTVSVRSGPVYQDRYQKSLTASVCMDDVRNSESRVLYDFVGSHDDKRVYSILIVTINNIFT